MTAAREDEAWIIPVSGYVPAWQLEDGKVYVYHSPCSRAYATTQMSAMTEIGLRAWLVPVLDWTVLHPILGRPPRV